MDSAKLRPCARLVYGTIALFLTLVATSSTMTGQSFPGYNHVFLVIMEPTTAFEGTPVRNTAEVGCGSAAGGK